MENLSRALWLYRTASHCRLGLFLYYSARYPALIGLGFVAYMFGLRHAFDADHIAAIDDTVRYMLQKGKKPLGVGFFFSLRHYTIVLALAVAITFAAAAVKAGLSAMQNIGGLIGAGVSGTFLWVIGIINLLVLLDILKVWDRQKPENTAINIWKNCLPNADS